MYGLLQLLPMHHEFYNIAIAMKISLQQAVTIPHILPHFRGKYLYDLLKFPDKVPLLNATTTLANFLWWQEPFGVVFSLRI